MTVELRAGARLSRVFVKPTGSADRPRGLAWVVASEAASSALGFLALIHLARRLGPDSFGGLEYASAVSAWLLVLVRGGMDVVAYREAARHPRTVAAWTEVLLGLRLTAALIGYPAILGLACLAGPGRGDVMAVAGLLLFASAGAADVGPRASGRLGWVALAQAVRSVASLGAIVFIVRRPGQGVEAAACLVAAEALGAAVFGRIHWHEWGPIRPRWRRRAGLILARRGAVAGLSRFLRVTLFGLDLLVLGNSGGPGLGPYAAGRRVVFALLALALVAPAMLGPSIGRAWDQGAQTAAARINRAMGGLWALALPASLGLILTADRVIPALFGDGYRDGGPWLALLAARLPFLVSGTFAQSALVNSRREGWCLTLIAFQTVIALATVPASAWWGGPWGVGWATLGVEAAGAAGAWWCLGRLGVGARPGLPSARVVAGCVALAGGCRLASQAPLAVTCLTGALAYGVVWSALERLPFLPSPLSEGGLRGVPRRTDEAPEAPPPTPPFQGGETC